VARVGAAGREDGGMPKLGLSTLTLGRTQIPIMVNLGSPIYAGHTLERTQAALCASMNALLHAGQKIYPDRAGRIACRAGWTAVR
jgi:hypothetical protein